MIENNTDASKSEAPAPLTLDRFIEFARERHSGQTSLSGEPYIEHLLRVLDNTRAILDRLPEGMISPGDRLEAELAAVGHDMIEDGRATEGDILSIGGTASLVRRLNALSRMDPKPVYQHWIVGIVSSGDLVVVIVKLADNQDNNSEDRIAALPPEMRSIRKRYDRAFATLNSGLDQMIAEYLADTTRQQVS